MVNSELKSQDPEHILNNLSIVAKKIEITDAMRDAIESGVSTFSKYNLRIAAVKAIVNIEKKEKKEKASIELTIQMPKHDTIVIKQLDDDLYAAIDTATSRAQKFLRRYHDKIKSHREEKGSHIKNSYHHIPMFMTEEIAIEEEDEIVPSDLFLHKPMEIADALTELKATGNLFFVFNDMDNKKRVLYKRKDNKYGLY